MTANTSLITALLLATGLGILPVHAQETAPAQTQAPVPSQPTAEAPEIPQADVDACQEEARIKSAYDPSKEESSGGAATVGKGAAAGAAAGWVVGAIAGGSKTKATIVGAGVGAAGGAVKNSMDEKDIANRKALYEQTYKSCLEAKGYVFK